MSILLSDFVLRHSFVIRHSSFVICLLAFVAGIGTAFAEKRPITEKDLFDLSDRRSTGFAGWLAHRVCAGRSTRKRKVITLRFGQYLSQAGSASSTDKGDHDSGPAGADGKFLLFVRATEKDGKPEPTLAILPTAGGDSFVFTDLPKGAANPVWAPDGKSSPSRVRRMRRISRSRKRKRTMRSRGHPPPLKLRRTSRPRLQPNMRATCA